MNQREQIKRAYNQIASVQDSGYSCSCNPNICSPSTNQYRVIEGYAEVADYGLGCGMPTSIDNLLSKGNTVLDLGCGAGNDVFIASRMVSEKGFVYGIDFSSEMIQKANTNAAKLNVSNVKFVVGNIEQLPFEDNSFDSIISNCVFTLISQKKTAFKEVHRTLKKGGQFGISDVVFEGEAIPYELLQKAYTKHGGCINNPIALKDYIQLINSIGFKDVALTESKEMHLRASELQHLNSDEQEALNNSKTKINSITIKGIK